MRPLISSVSCQTLNRLGYLIDLKIKYYFNFLIVSEFFLLAKLSSIYNEATERRPLAEEVPRVYNTYKATRQSKTSTLLHDHNDHGVLQK